MVGVFLFSWVAVISLFGSTEVAVAAMNPILGSDWSLLFAVTIVIFLLLSAIAGSLVGIVFWSLLYSRWLSRDERLRLFRSVYPSGSFSRLGEVLIHRLW